MLEELDKLRHENEDMQLCIERLQHDKSNISAFQGKPLL